MKKLGIMPGTTMNPPLMLLGIIRFSYTNILCYREAEKSQRTLPLCSHNVILYIFFVIIEGHCQKAICSIHPEDEIMKFMLVIKSKTIQRRP
jgi:hypothetical protein